MAIRFQFRLRTIFVVIVLAALLFVVTSPYIRQYLEGTPDYTPYFYSGYDSAIPIDREEGLNRNDLPPEVEN